MDINIDINNSTELLNEIEQITERDAEEMERRRIKHNKYVTTYVPCTCGNSVMRCNMTAHKRTKKH